ncbi:MAG: N-acetylglucosamine-6-phosphate deacetylase [Spirochaetales bacterium]|nr:N-acetylglucosamine-6-phosphate deacetylase [Spirochaetales bacterium]
MILKGRLVLKHKVVKGSVRLDGQEIREVREKTADIPEGEQVIDYGDAYIMPGFVDTHTHGSGGFDFMDGTAEDIIGAAKSHARHGTTTCLPTTLTSSDDDMLLFLKNLREVHTMQEEGKLETCARMPGSHFEGPYFDMVEKGAQDPRYIMDPVPEHYNKLLEAADGLVRRWSVAPERPGAMQFIDDMVKHGILVSGAHTAATYDVVSEAFDHGLSLLTHFYSGMSTITRRGGFRVLGTVESGYLIDGLNIELICDGSHLPPELLKMIFKLKDHGSIIACSDSMRGAGMPDGPSILGPKHNGTACIIEDGIAKMPDRTCFAGSVATGDRLARTLHKIVGLEMDEVSRILCLQPAELIGMEKEIGSIEAGKKADLVVCNDNIDIKEVYIGGKAIM